MLYRTAVLHAAVALAAPRLRLQEAARGIDEGAGGGQKELMELTGLKSYPASLTMTAARRVTDSFCQKAVELVLQTDVAMKTGADDPERLLELLLVQLSQEARHG